MTTLSDNALKLFVDLVRRYFEVTTTQQPTIAAAYLGSRDMAGYDFSGLVEFSGAYTGNVIVSMPRQLLRELLLLQGETDLSEANLLDAVGEIANTIAGNARRALNAALDISVPRRLHDAAGLASRVRQRPYAIALRWNRMPAMVYVDVERRA